MASVSRTAASRSTWRGVEPSRGGDLAASAVGSAVEATPKPRLHDLQALVASVAALAGATLVAEMASAEDSRVAAAAAVASAGAIVVSGVVALAVAGIVVLVPRMASALLLMHPQVLATAAAVAATVTETATVAMVVGMTEVAAHMMTDRADVMVEAGRGGGGGGGGANANYEPVRGGREYRDYDRSREDDSRKRGYEGGYEDPRKLRRY